MLNEIYDKILLFFMPFEDLLLIIIISLGLGFSWDFFT